MSTSITENEKEREEYLTKSVTHAIGRLGQNISRLQAQTNKSYSDQMELYASIILQAYWLETEGKLTHEVEKAAFEANEAMQTHPSHLADVEELREEAKNNDWLTDRLSILTGTWREYAEYERIVLYNKCELLQPRGCPDWLEYLGTPAGFRNNLRVLSMKELRANLFGDEFAAIASLDANYPDWRERLNDGSLDEDKKLQDLADRCGLYLCFHPPGSYEEARYKHEKWGWLEENIYHPEIDEMEMSEIED